MLGGTEGIVRDYFHQGLRVEDVVPWKSRRGWGRWAWASAGGFFLEADDAFILVHFDDAKAARRLDGHWQGSYCGFRSLTK